MAYDGHSITYNDEGVRTSKTKNGVTTTYYLNGTQIAGEETNKNITVYLYDLEGLPLGMQYHGASYAEDVWDVYWYEKNLFGDIVAVYDRAGTKLLSYEYDAYGYCYVRAHNNGNATTAYNNPFRYRGYYYDRETGLYYVSSRYYDPKIGRWINADIPETLTSDFENFAQYNLFAYCFNNPVNLSDETGTWPSWATKLAIGVGAIVIGAAVVAATAATGVALEGIVVLGGVVLLSIGFECLIREVSGYRE